MHADLLLVHPGNRTSIYQDLGRKFSAVDTPIWAAMIATLAHDAGLNVEILDAEAESLTPDQLSWRVMAERPRLVAIVVYGHQPNASTQNMTYAALLAQEIQRRGNEVSLVLALGGHVAALPVETLQEAAFDFVATGEGAITAVQLALAIRDGARGDRDYAKVPGLMWFDVDGILRQTAAPVLLKEVPRAAYDLLPMRKYRSHNHQALVTDIGRRQPYASIYTSLGCPYSCHFCCIQSPFKAGEAAMGMRPTVNSYRLKDPQVVVAEIDHLVEEYGVEIIRVADELFVLNPKHVFAICELLKTRSYRDRLNLWAYARIDSVKPGMLDALRAAGFRWLCYGIESAAQDVLDDVDKGFDVSKTIKIVRDTEAAGIEVLSNFIVGLPEDTHETMQQTLDLAVSLNTAWFNVYSAMAYPGSQLYTEAKKKHLALPKNWTGYSQHSYDCTPLPTRHVSAADVLRFRDNAFHTYFERPAYLDMVERKFGLKARGHIVQMTQVRLKRELLGDTP